MYYLIDNMDDKSSDVVYGELIKSLAANGKVKLAKHYGKLLGKHFCTSSVKNRKIISEEINHF